MRPDNFEDVVGQERAKVQLNILCESAKKRADSIPHMCFSGRSGTGKSTLARIVGKYGAEYYSINAPTINNTKDMVNVLKKINYRDILFIDEIHKLTDKTQHFLYQVMEDYFYEHKDGNKIFKVDMPKFTIIGATTHTGLLNKPLLNRFKHVIEFEPYSLDELAVIVNRVAKSSVKLEYSQECARAIARTCKGNPRHAITRAEWLRDYIFCQNNPQQFVKTLNTQKVIEIIEMQGIDKYGLNVYERKYLDILLNGRASLSTLSSRLGLDKENIVNDIEPYLIEIGLVEVGTRGRELVYSTWEKMYND